MSTSRRLTASSRACGPTPSAKPSRCEPAGRERFADILDAVAASAANWAAATSATA